MDRRTFFKKGFGTSLVMGAGISGVVQSVFSAQPEETELPYDLVAVKGGEPEDMLRAGIKAIGGISRFVKKGQTVVVKPNIGWDVEPERGGNTHPKLVEEVIRQCYQAGAREVTVFDHTCDLESKCYSRSGIGEAVKRAGGKIVAGDREENYREVKIPHGKSITRAKEHELLLKSDVYINVPILKSHSGARLTISMKNQMGNVWDRGIWHRTDLHQCIADYAAYRKPALNIIDAYYVMKQNGPRGLSVEDVVVMKSLLLSTDMVAADAAAAKLFGLEPSDVRHIQIASDQKIGQMDLKNLRIKRITV